MQFLLAILLIIGFIFNLLRTFLQSFGAIGNLIWTIIKIALIITFLPIVAFYLVIAAIFKLPPFGGFATRNYSGFYQNNAFQRDPYSDANYASDFSSFGESEHLQGLANLLAVNVLRAQLKSGVAISVITSGVRRYAQSSRGLGINELTYTREYESLVRSITENRLSSNLMFPGKADQQMRMLVGYLHQPQHRKLAELVFQLQLQVFQELTRSTSSRLGSTEFSAIILSTANALGIELNQAYKIIEAVAPEFLDMQTSSTSDLNRTQVLKACTVLGCTPDITAKEFRTLKRKLLMKYHPDKAPAGKEEEFKRKFQEIGQACDVVEAWIKQREAQ